LRAPRQLQACLNILELRELARRRLPGPLFEYLDGAAETERTAERNTAAFDEVQLIPRCLVNVDHIEVATRLLGQEVDWPVMCSPSGASRFYHPNGEMAVARAAQQTGTLYGVSVMGTYTLEEVATNCGPKVFQLLVFRDRDLTRELMSRAQRAGYPALCLTVDAAVRGKRERELRIGLGLPLRLSPQSLARFASCPRWCIGQARSGPLSLANLASWSGHRRLAAQSRFAAEQLDTSVTWQDVRDLKDQWQGAFALKGIMSAEDACRAVDAGASAVIVSNHGGRQLDGAAGALDVLPDIVKAVGDRAEVILDGGIRRGVHVLKALALGATACAVGRAPLFGLGAGGEEGVRKAFDILKSELVVAMKLCGCTDVASVERDLVRRLGTWG
jgi:L-lactate dehydrogenase (cytochrome)